MPERVVRVQEAVREQGWDALLCLKPQHTFYLTDFNPIIYSHPVAVVLPVGHGLGLGPHEPPSLGPHDRTVLRPGMVVTFEPNLRVPGVGGLQHSDTVLLVDGGCEFITAVRRDFLQV
jgi:Xaa-Pro aminopeptidase